MYATQTKSINVLTKLRVEMIVIFKEQYNRSFGLQNIDLSEYID